MLPTLRQFSDKNTIMYSEISLWFGRLRGVQDSRDNSVIRYTKDVSQFDSNQEIGTAQYTCKRSVQIYLWRRWLKYHI